MFLYALVPGAPVFVVTVEVLQVYSEENMVINPFVN